MKTILRNSTESRATRHDETVSFECCDCHTVKPVQTSGGTGYACLPDGGLCCYPCTDVRERADLLTRDKVCQYVSGDGKRLTTWTGGDLGRVSLGERHPWSRERFYVSATDCHGQRWHGTGAPGMWANLKKCKA
jgi:hypothetical protein